MIIADLGTSTNAETLVTQTLFAPIFSQRSKYFVKFLKNEYECFLKLSYFFLDGLKNFTQ